MQQSTVDTETELATPALTSTIPTWNLSDLYSSIDDPALESDLAASQEEATELEKAFKGKLAALDGDELADVIERYGRLYDRIGRAYSYAQLCAAAD
ncbi:MAG: oligoendopeptidase F, partial [Pseudomonadota bacterium]